MSECKKCDLHKFRKRQVIGRGSLPCKILFIGEAPGKSENVRGIPFVGPAGMTLNTGIEKAVKQAGLFKPPSYYITNLVQCRPTDEKYGPNRQPTKDEFLACKDNLEKVYEQAKPEKVVFLGKIPQKFLRKIYPDAQTLQHPSFINRRGGIGSPAFVTFVRNLSTIFKEVIENGN